MLSYYKASVRTTILLLSICLILLPSVIIAQTSLLDFRVMDSVANSGAMSVPISVYMNNYEDTVSGYSFWLHFSRPDIASFQLAFDTTGTLSSSWEMVQVNHVGDQPYNIKVAAIANWPGPPTTPGIAPQQSGRPLIKLLLNIQDIPDTTTDRTVDILVADASLSDFTFSDPTGQVIGTVQDSSVLNTTYFACTEWVGDSCANWEEVSSWQPYDSLESYWYVFAIIDTASVHINNGSITIIGGYVCGNIDDDPSGVIDISDLVYLVDWMFIGGTEPNALMAADCNGDGVNDISDLVWLVDYMFIGGPPPLCGK